MKKILIILISFFILDSCARTGVPSGGPKDITPPKLVKAIPDTLSTNVPTNLKSIKLYFNELVQLKDYSKNILISPPIDPAPTFSPIGMPSREVEVKFNGELKKNTTYTINFGQAIVDNNEYNPYSYFNYVFSTGKKIDSLTLKGSVKDLFSKEMEKNIIVALYAIDSAYSDSAIFKEKPYYITKLDTANTYQFKYLKPGKFRLIAFNDKIPNSRVDIKQEKMAFADSIINTKTTSEVPTLYMFKPPQPFRYVDGKQNGYGRIDFYVTGNPKEMSVTGFAPKIPDNFIEHKAYSDTLQFYFNPEKLELKDKSNRLRFTLTHDGITDTIPSVNYNNSTKHNFKIFGRNLIYSPKRNYEIASDNPIDTINAKFISVQIDSTKIDFKTEKLSNKKFKLNFPIEFDKKYKVNLLPGALIDYFGKKNDTINLTFSTGKERDYGNIKITLKNKPQHSFWLKLFDENNKEVESVYSNNDVFEFKYLTPKKYYFQLWVDENENKRYDTGDILNKRQPEVVYIYPQEIEVKAFWDINETWELPPLPKAKDTTIEKQIKTLITLYLMNILFANG